jgi:putative pyrroloquinoline-quinone binding quinoprotein
MKTTNMIKYLTVLSAVLVLLSSCGGDYSLEGKTLNMYGGVKRSNSYEKYGGFLRYFSYVEKIKSTDTTGAIQAPLVVSGLETVVATKGGTICWINDRATTWEYSLPKDRLIASTMIADQDHNIYAIDNYGMIHGITNKGEKKFEIQFGDTNQTIEIYSDLLAFGKSFVAATSNGKIAKFNYDGELVWEYNSELSPATSFAGDRDGAVFIPLSNNEFGKTDSLVIIKTNGEIAWAKAFPNTRLFRTPTLGKDLILIAGMREIQGQRLSILFALDSKGEIKWEKQLNVVPRFISLSENEDIYVVGYNAGIGEAISAVYCFDKEGKVKWNKFFELGVPAPLMIAENSVAFVGKDRESSGCFFLNKETGYVEKVIDFEKEAACKLFPAVSPDGRITFACMNFLGLVRIDDTAINKMLP